MVISILLLFRHVNPYYWTSQLVQLNVRSRLRNLAVAYFLLPKGINWNGAIHLKQFVFEVQDKDKKGLWCTLSKLAIQVQAQYTLHPARGLPTWRCRPWSRPKRPTVYKPTQVTHKPAYPTTQGVGESTYLVLGGFSIAP